MVIKNIRSICFFSIVLIFSFNVFAKNSDKSIIEIGNCYQLQDITKMEANYVQVSDIDCSSINQHKPIGDGSKPFIGSYDGQNFTITGITFVQKGDDYNGENAGLFGIVKNATIKRVVLTDYYIEATSGDAGALAGVADVSIIENSYAQNGKVVGGDRSVGGLVGYSRDSHIMNTYAKGEVVGKDSLYSVNVGGLVGHSHSDLIENSYAAGNVKAYANVAGGLIGRSYATEIVNCYATGDVSSTRGSVGGLIGETWVTDLYKTYATGNVTAEGSYVGGLVGYADGGGTIENSYAQGNVTGERYVGGAIGYEAWAANYINIYAVGLVEGENAGGLIGQMISYFPPNIIASYWDTETSGQTFSEGGEGRTTSQMKLLDTSIPTYEGWNENVWFFEENEYPVLF